MRVRPATFRLAAAFFAVLPLLRAQAADAAKATPAPLRVEIVGASVSAGFVDGPLTGGNQDNKTVALLTLVRAWLADIDAKVESRADMMMFVDAEGRGSGQVARARKQPPDLVLAVDFLFWFGYGYVDAGADGEIAARLARLKCGLGLLDQFECAMIVSDLPDVAGASQRMISPRQIPSEACLEQLNAAIVEWAKTRPRVRLFPARTAFGEMKQKGLNLQLASGPLAVPAGGLLQSDLLHASRLGMAYLGLLLQEHVAAVVPKERKLPAWSLDQFVAAANAGTDVDDLRQKAPAGAPAGAGAGATDKDP